MSDEPSDQSAPLKRFQALGLEKRVTMLAMSNCTPEDTSLAPLRVTSP